MNGVAVVRSERRLDAAALAEPSGFTLPVATLGPHGRPRWEESSHPGVVAEVSSDAPAAWLPVADRLNGERVGTEGHPPWRAIVIQHARGSTLVLALLHALADARSGMWIARRLIERAHPGHVGPACEDMLPPAAFGRADAQELMEQWWLPRASARWEAIGVDRLAGYLASPAPSVLDRAFLGAEDTKALRARCRSEKVSLNAAVALALRDAVGVSAVRYAVDMCRFIAPHPDPAPGVILSHVDVDLPAGTFWDAARSVRAGLRERLASGASGDALLRLPGLLLARDGQDVAAFAATAPQVTISDLTRIGIRGAEGCTMLCTTSSARGGGAVVSISFEGGGLNLVSSAREDHPPIPLDDIARRLAQAA